MPKTPASFKLGQTVYVVVDVTGDDSRPPAYEAHYARPFTVSKGKITAIRLVSDDEAGAYPFSVDVEDEDGVWEIFSEARFLAKTLHGAEAAGQKAIEEIRIRLAATCLTQILAWALVAGDSGEIVASLPRRTAVLEAALVLAGAKDQADWQRAVKAYWASCSYDRETVLAKTLPLLKTMARNLGTLLPKNIVRKLPSCFHTPYLEETLYAVLTLLKKDLGYIYDRQRDARTNCRTPRQDRSVGYCLHEEVWGYQCRHGGGYSVPHVLHPTPQHRRLSRSAGRCSSGGWLRHLQAGSRVCQEAELMTDEEKEFLKKVFFAATRRAQAEMGLGDEEFTDILNAFDTFLNEGNENMSFFFGRLLHEFHKDGVQYAQACLTSPEAEEAYLRKLESYQ